MVGTRYKTVNLACFSRYGTIEFRQHQGTHNGEKIVSWIKFVVALLDASVREVVQAYSRESLRNLLIGLRLDSETIAYFEERQMELE